MGVGDQHNTQDALPPGMNRYSLFRRLGGPQGWSGRVRKISPPPVFDPRTVHPVASRCTDWDIPAHRNRICIISKSSDGLSWRWKQEFSAKRWWLCSWLHDITYTRSLLTWRRNEQVSHKRRTYQPDIQIGPTKPHLLRTQCYSQELKQPEI